MCNTCHRDLPEEMFYPEYVARNIFICCDCKRAVHQKGRLKSKTGNYVPLKGEKLEKRKANYRSWYQKIKTDAKDNLMEEYFRSLREQEENQNCQALQAT